MIGYGHDYPDAIEFDPTLPDPEDGAGLLDEVQAFLARFIAFPSDAARVATVLWCVHAHATAFFESTPRIGYLAPEKECGKTRALEIVGLLVPNPMHAVNATPAALFRSIPSQPTILYDEIDTVFGPKAQQNEEIRGLLNAGHRRSGVAYRCVGEGTKQQVVEFPAYAAVAFAGMGDLPDTIMSRTIVIAMRRRSPTEHVDPYRIRMHEPIGHEIRDRIASWVEANTKALTDAWPRIPDGVVDRAADVWEPLLTIADAAGGHWPETARVACVTHVTQARQREGSLGVRLLTDLKEVFGNQDRLSTEDILKALCELDESPWADMRGKTLDSRGLSQRLGKYDVGPKPLRIGGRVIRGYERTDFVDAWTRYVPEVTEPEGDPYPATYTPGYMEAAADDPPLLAGDRARRSLSRLRIPTPPDAAEAWRSLPRWVHAMTSLDRQPIVDLGAGLLCLDDGFHAVEAVTPDGERTYWILNPDGVDAEPATIPAHERLGPLPVVIRGRVWTYRCGEPTQAGGPCRTPVPRAGLTCARHRTKAKEPQP
jgi:hypothetical protein